MNRDVGNVVSAIEKSDLDQVLSRRRPSSRWGPPFGVVFARCAWRCSTLPGAASAVLASSPCEGCCFQLLAKMSQLSIRMYRYTSVSCMPFRKTTGGWKVACTPWVAEVEGSIPGALSFFYFLGVPFFSISVRHVVCVWFHNSIPGPDWW